MIPILMYHDIGEDIERARCISVRKFREQMRYLFHNGFRTVSLSDFLYSADNLDLRKKVVITFDDGRSGNYSYAFPILQEFGFTAIFFIVTDWINKTGMVSWEQLMEMSECGMAIQSHALSHTPLSTLGYRQIDREIAESRKIIENNLGNRVEFLSLPHGDYDHRVKMSAKQNGYRGILSSSPEYYSNERDDMLMGRIEIRGEYSMKRFADIVQKEHSLMWLRTKYRVAFAVKSCLGINNYLKLYRVLKPESRPNEK